MKFTKSFLLLFIIAINVFGQEKSYNRITTMHTDLQKYADTTFILRKSSIGTAGGSNYYILSKSGKLINIYYYGDLTKGIEMPKEIKGRLKYLSLLRDTTKVGINVYFSPQYINEKDGTLFWSKMVSEMPWQIDEANGNKCKNKIYDGMALTLFLITKNEIKSLLFFNPAILQKECPGNKDRASILKIDELFFEYFKFN